MPRRKGIAQMNEPVENKFERKLERIDAIVKQLDGTDVPLETAVELFKEGKKLAAECEEELKLHQGQLDKAMGEGSSSA